MKMHKGFSTTEPRLCETACLKSLALKMTRQCTESKEGGSYPKFLSISLCSLGLPGQFLEQADHSRAVSQSLGSVVRCPAPKQLKTFMALHALHVKNPLRTIRSTQPAGRGFLSRVHAWHPPLTRVNLAVIPLTAP